MNDIIEAILRIASPFRPIGELIPKVMYDDCGVLYDPKTNGFLYAEISEDYTITVKRPVSPVSVIFPNELGVYGMTDDELHDFVENDFCGEADDFSCYAYFKYC